MIKDSLGDRMKENYENIERRYLTKRMPTLIRVDGKAFHSFTKGFGKPFDIILVESMWDTAEYLCANVAGCKLAYMQSDEITLLLTDYDKLETKPWFDKNITKMLSVSASMATMAFNKAFTENVRVFELSLPKKPDEEVRKLFERYNSRKGTAIFDSRVFNVPKEEVCNAFIWRQQDAMRNAVQMLGQSKFSQKQLQNKNCNDIQERLRQEWGIDFNDLPTHLKRGACAVKEYYDKDGVQRSRWVIDKDIPVFTQDREYIEKYLTFDEAEERGTNEWQTGS